jgi:hypothetical protein
LLVISSWLLVRGSKFFVFKKLIFKFLEKKNKSTPRLNEQPTTVNEQRSTDVHVKSPVACYGKNTGRLFQIIQRLFLLFL